MLPGMCSPLYFAERGNMGEGPVETSESETVSEGTEADASELGTAGVYYCLFRFVLLDKQCTLTLTSSYE